MVDSLFTRTATLIGDHQLAPVAQALTATPTNHPSLYTTVLNLNPELFTTDQVAGTVVLLTAGFAYTFEVSGNVAGPVNNSLILDIFKNGNAEGRTRLVVATDGPGEFKAFENRVPFGGILANDVIDLRLSSENPGSFDFAALVLNINIQPTTSAV
jgi:hypothetical protein